MTDALTQSCADLARWLPIAQNLATVWIGGGLACVGMGIGAALINWRISRKNGR